MTNAISIRNERRNTGELHIRRCLELTLHRHRKKKKKKKEKKVHRSYCDRDRAKFSRAPSHELKLYEFKHRRSRDIFSMLSSHTARGDFRFERFVFSFLFSLFPRLNATYFSGEHIWYSKQRHRGRRDFHRFAKDVPYQA